MEAGELKGPVDSFGAAVAEEHGAHVRIDQPDEPLRQPNGGHVGVAGVRVGEGQLLHLAGGHLRQLLPSVPYRHIPERGEAIDVLAAVDVPQQRPFAPHEDHRLLVVAHVELGVDLVGDVCLQQPGDLAFIHGLALPWAAPFQAIDRFSAAQA